MVHLQLLMLMVSFCNVFGYIEYVEISNCESCILMLTCRHLNAVIAVFNTTFQPFNENSSYVEDFQSILPPVHPRLAVNRRCSGVNHCSFILDKDCPGADRWGPGNFTVKYACVSERRIVGYCNENITLPDPEVIGVSEGFIRNPGYPKFYLGHPDCIWRIQAPPMQRIKLTILDLSLISSPDPLDRCHDILEIQETGNTVFASCIEQEPATEILSVSDVLDITLSSSASLTARRGVLFHYTALGCATPTSPRDGYLVYRNDTVVIFTCCVGFVFPETQERVKTLTCYGHSWDDHLPLPNCIKQTTDSDLAIREIINNNRSNMTESETLSDIVLPTILIIALFVINSVIVFVIYKYKKRKAALLYTEEEELGTMTMQRNGN